MARNTAWSRARVFTFTQISVFVIGRFANDMGRYHSICAFIRGRSSRIPILFIVLREFAACSRRLRDEFALLRKSKISLGYHDYCNKLRAVLCRLQNSWIDPSDQASIEAFTIYLLWLMQSRYFTWASRRHRRDVLSFAFVQSKCWRLVQRRLRQHVCFSAIKSIDWM